MKEPVDLYEFNDEDIPDLSEAMRNFEVLHLYNHEIASIEAAKRHASKSLARAVLEQALFDLERGLFVEDVVAFFKGDWCEILCIIAGLSCSFLRDHVQSVLLSVETRKDSAGD